MSITDKSGTAGIAHWLNDHLKVPEEKVIDKGHPGVFQIKKWIDKEYAGQRITSISNGEMLQQAKLHFPQLFHSEMSV
ncbi:MAG: histone-lysine N-methyltransferase, partial [Bacteroidetes bacterium]|nr:histone-lysine N-methyltransferase [Bacteroidota bacterium]